MHGRTPNTVLRGRQSFILASIFEHFLLDLCASDAENTVNHAFSTWLSCRPE